MQMYWQHFGLSGPVAGQGIARDGRVFTAAHTDVLARIPAALQTTGSAVVCLSGPAGVGKTTLTAHAAREGSARLEIGWLGHPPLSPQELLEHLLVEFGFTPFRHSRAERMQMWRAHLTEMAMTDTLVCILVEHTEQLADDVLQSLEALTAADPNGCPGAHLILMSREPLNARFAATPALEGLAQRTRACLALTPLDSDASRAYLDFAFAACGGELSSIVDAAAVAALHDHSGGLVRRLDTLTEAALTAAASAGLAELDAATVDKVAAELGGVPTATGVHAALTAHRTTEACANTGDPAFDSPAAGTGVETPAETPDAVPDPQADDELPVLTDSVEIASDPAFAGAACDADDNDAESETAALRALANALALEDVSNSMAERLFGEAERELLRDTLAIPGWQDRTARSGTG